MQQNPEVFNQEIKELEAKLEAKKREMAEAGQQHPEKKIFKEVLREHAPFEVQSNATPVTGTQPAPVDEPTNEEKQHLNALVTHSFTKGIGSAVAEAKKTNNPYFIDLLHDRLADEYYEKLVQARKINPS